MHEYYQKEVTSVRYDERQINIAVETKKNNIDIRESGRILAGAGPTNRIRPYMPHCEIAD